MGPSMANTKMAGGMGPSMANMAAPAAAPMAAQEGGNVKECYRLCLNPKMNPGCSVSIGAASSSSAASMLEVESKQADPSNWALDKDSNCLANCVRVCVNVHSMVQLQLQSGTYTH